MNIHRAVKLCILAVPLMGFAHYKLTHPTYTFRYRLTIEVQTPEGLKTGSGVIEESTGTTSQWPNPGVREWISVKGDAIYVDLGRHGGLVALLSFGHTGGEQYQFDLLPIRAIGAENNSTPATWKKIQHTIGAIELHRDNMPTMITFRDPQDPSSAQVVVPDKLPEVFGPGVQLKRAWIEITKDLVTRQIDEALPWWKLPGRPAISVRVALLHNEDDGSSIVPESLFRREELR